MTSVTSAKRIIQHASRTKIDGKTLAIPYLHEGINKCISRQIPFLYGLLAIKKIMLKFLGRITKKKNSENLVLTWHNEIFKKRQRKEESNLPNELVQMDNRTGIRTNSENTPNIKNFFFFRKLGTAMISHVLKRYEE